MTLSDLASPEAGLSKAGNSFTIWRHARRKRYATDATHKLPRTWAQIAIIPRNNDSEAKAAASSTTARNITTPLLAFLASAQPDGPITEERKENIVPPLFSVKRSLQGRRTSSISEKTQEFQ